MKISKLLLISIITFIAFTNMLFSQEIKFKAEKMEVGENGKLIIGYNSNTDIPEDNINIFSKKVEYNKNKSLVIFTDKVFFYDKKNNIVIEGDKIIYEKNENLIFSEGPTKYNIDDKYDIKSENTYFDRSKKIIFGDKEAIIEDKEKNIFKLKEKYKILINEEIIKSKKSLILDKNDNKYIFEDLVLNLQTNEILGKEIKVEFKDTYFGNENNDPILKGRSSYSNEKELKVYKAVFSTCNTQDKECRGWEVNSDEFRHDKEKKVFEYRNSWLKLFDYKVFFTPYFNHPDPSVKRKSGFLTPYYGTSDSLGTQLNFPYFKVIDIDKDITFNPRYYADKSFLLQNEYRQALKNSNILSDFSFLIGEAGTKGHLFYNQIGKINNNTDFELNIQNVKGDNYLKTHKLKDNSLIIKDDSVLVSNLDLNWQLNDSNLFTSFKIYEDLSRNYHDRYQYVLPDFNFTKNIIIPDSYNGKFNFNSYGYNKLYNTNVTESVLTNDFLFSSNEYVNSKGIASNYNLLLKNSNDHSNNSTNFQDNLNYNLFGLFKYDASFPLQKRMGNYTHFLKPLISFRYSPNGNSDLSEKDLYLNYNNAFGINRISESSQVEGGESINLGLEFKRKDSNGLDIIDLKLANIIKIDEDYRMPDKSKLNKKRSDIFGEINYNFSNKINLGYYFSYDKDLKYSNRDELSFDLNANNFLTNISYYSVHNDLPNVETIKNSNKFYYDNENSLGFEVSKDLSNNFTQYYNLMYSHETDCISFNLNYNKSFYRDGILEPTKSLSFLIKIIPFTELGVPNLGELINN
tara:strand:- start:3534 stop:5930 length:2397 start_codon:yes stop_codon:yes gene_type:complete